MSSSRGEKNRPMGEKSFLGGFLTKLRKRHIIETLAAFIGGGWLVIEVVERLLVGHYRFPEETIDLTVVSIVGALLSTIIWRWFRGTEKRPGNVKIEVLLIPLIILATIAIDLNLAFDIAAVSGMKLLTGIIALCLGIAWVVFKSLQWAAAPSQITFEPRPKELEIPKTVEAKSAKSIVVLPFKNMSADPEQEYFCEGLAEELINAFAKIQDLRVVARTSAFHFKGKDLDVREIGRKLNVETVLEGSVRKSGNRLRISAQLINVADGYHLWSERFDRELADVFAIQEEISLSITERLKINLLGEEKERMIKRYSENFDAYNLYLKGLYYRRKMIEKEIQKAIECFNQAIEIDPDYALAYAGIAYAYLTLGFYAPVTFKEVYPEAKRAALKALELDDHLAETHESLGLISAYFEWNWENANREFKRALELNPGYVWARFHNANALLYLGNFDGAIKGMKRAHELDPLNVAFNRNLGGAYLLAGQLEKAAEILRRTIEMDPAFPATHLSLAWVYFQKSMYEEALAELQEEKNLPKSVLEPRVGIVYARMGRREEARQILNKCVALSPNEFISPYGLAALCFALGENDLGFQWLERAFEVHDIWMYNIKTDFLMDNIREDARFKTVLKKMNLT